ncbi:MAG: hypothetical protein ABFS16_16210 [Bacteroidota bacterium]
MKTTLLLIVFSLFFGHVFSQKSLETNQPLSPTTLFDIQRNSVSLETNLILTLDLDYERLLPVKDHFGVLLGGGYTMGIGFAYGAHWLNAETMLVLGGPKHIFETGLTAFLNIDSDSDDNEDNGDSGPGLKIGYRFQGKKGLLLKANVTLITFEDPPIIPMLGIGYSF